jgi:hypothetical protein
MVGQEHAGPDRVPFTVPHNRLTLRHRDVEHVGAFPVRFAGVMEPDMALIQPARHTINSGAALHITAERHHIAHENTCLSS